MLHLNLFSTSTFIKSLCRLQVLSVHQPKNSSRLTLEAKTLPASSRLLLFAVFNNVYEGLKNVSETWLLIHAYVWVHTAEMEEVQWVFVLWGG